LKWKYSGHFVLVLNNSISVNKIIQLLCHTLIKIRVSE
jgi:hypothetical protein